MCWKLEVGSRSLDAWRVELGVGSCGLKLGALSWELEVGSRSLDAWRFELGVGGWE